jgi:MYXO-CTERM domain-containing protein
MGPPDAADAGPSDPRDGGVSDRGQSDLGDLPGDATPTPGASGGGGGCTLDPAPTPHLGWLALLLLTLRRRRP